MGKVRLTKLEAARRQIDAAIRMTFADEDPAAIHSVIAAANRIIRDLCEQRGDVESYLRFTDWIAPGYAAKFWKAFNASASFLKHAENDPNGVYELDEEATGLLIAFAIKWYRDLGNSLSPEMRVFGGWWIPQNPEVIQTAQGRRPDLVEQFTVIGKQLNRMTRAEKLTAAQIALNQVRVAA